MLSFNPVIIPELFTEEEIARESALLRKHLFTWWHDFRRLGETLAQHGFFMKDIMSLFEDIHDNYTRFNEKQYKYAFDPWHTMDQRQQKQDVNH